MNKVIENLESIANCVCNYFKISKKINPDDLSKKINQGGYLHLSRNEKLEKYYKRATIIEIKENGQLLINAGKNNGIFEGCYLDLLSRRGKCLVVSVHKETCIANIQPEQIKTINLVDGTITKTPFYPKAYIEEQVGVSLWRAL